MLQLLPMGMSRVNADADESPPLSLFEDCKLAPFPHKKLEVIGGIVKNTASGFVVPLPMLDARNDYA